MRGTERGLCGLNHPVQVLASNLGRERRAARGRLILSALLFSILVIVPDSGFADPFPPLWVNGTGPAIHFSPTPWPNEPANPANCGDACGDWKPYTRFQREMADPRVQDPSNGGTSPQNYVNIASSCIDKTLPSIYYYLFRHPSDPARDVIMFRWRVEQIANNYATGPSAGTFAATNPWNSALWTVLFDLDGDGYRDLAAHLDGSSGAPSTAIDRIFGIWGEIPAHSLDYVTDPSVRLIAHNPTAFVGLTNRILNFQSALNPTENWPLGAGESSWDYGTTRARRISTNTCDEYFVDYQIPVTLLDASGLGGPRITRDTPLSMLFCTANSLNNPFQKDCAINKEWIGEAGRPAPFGDYLSFNRNDPYAQPIVARVTATAPSGCPGNYALTATVQDTIAIVNGTGVTSVRAVDFYYYYDADGDGLTNDAGSAWVFAAAASLQSGTVNTWTATWDATSLARGRYFIGVQAVDAEYQDINANNRYDAGIDVSLLDDGMTPTESRNRTFSYLTQAEVDALGGRPPQETWFANPDVTGTQTAVVGLALNTCGVAPEMTKSVSPSVAVAGGAVDFTLTIENRTGGTITVSEITDVLPAGFSYTSALGGTLAPTSSPVNGATGTLTWTFSPAVAVPAGGGAALVFRTTAPLVTGTYTNAAAAETSFGALSSNPSTVAVGSPRLTIAKRASAPSVNPGDTVTYTVTYSNDAPVDVTNVAVTDTLPTGVTFLSADSGGIYDGPTRTITWNVGNLPSATGPLTVTFQVSVDNPYGGSVPLVNTASVVSDQTPATTASASSYVNVPRPNVVLQKSAGSPLVSPGNTVTFTILYANNGTAAADTVVITDQIPGGFTFVSATGGGVLNGTAVTWTVGSLPADASGSATLTLRADNPYTGAQPAVNTVSATWDGNPAPLTSSAQVGVTQTGSVCNTYYFRNETGSVGFDGIRNIATTTPIPQAGDTGSGIPVTVPGGANNYVEALRFYQDPATANDVNFNGNITTSFYIDRNPGPGITIRATVYDYDSATGAQTQLGRSTTPFNGNETGPLTFTVATTGTLLKNHRLLWVLEVTSNNNQADTILFQLDGTVPNSISDTSPPIATTFANSRADFCVTPPASLVIDKQVDRTIAAAGDSLTYTISYSNTGQTAATSAQIVDTLPSGVTYVSSTGGGVHGGGTVTWSVGTIAAGSSGSVSVTAAVNTPLDPSITSLTNSASLSSDQTSPVTDSATTGISGRGGGGGGAPLLTVTKSADRTLLVPGDAVTYALTVLNAGTAAATSIQVSDDIPEQSYFAYVPGSISGGDSRSANGVPVGAVNWTVNSLAPGSSAVLTYRISVSALGVPDGVTALSNSAGLTTSEGATAQSNIVTVSVSTNPNLTFTKTANPSNGLAPGDTVTFALTVTNIGSGTAQGVTVSDPVPAHLSFTGITQGSGVFDAVNNRVVFDLGALAGGASATVSFTTVINDLPAGAVTIGNAAVVTASNASSRSATAGVTASAGPALSLSKTGPAQVAYPSAVLTADANGALTLFVNDATQFTVGQYVSVGGTIARITALAGRTITTDTPITAPSGTQVIGSVTFSLTYRNSGNAVAENTVLTDTLPAGAVFVEAPPGGSHTAGTVTFFVGSVSPDSGATVQVTIIPPGPGTMRNSAQITCSACPPPVDVSTNTIVGGLRVTKRTTTPTTAAPGTVTYIIEVENTLGLGANGVAVTDILPSGFTYASTQSILIDGAPTGAGSSPSAGDSVLSWSQFTIPSGARLLLTFSANVAGSVGAATYQNDAGATSSNAGVTPFDPLLTTAEDVTVLAPNTGLLQGHVFIDRNNNGIFDEASDTPLQGIGVAVTDSTNTLYIVATSDSGYFRRVVASGSATIDIRNGDLPAGLTLGAGFSDPVVITVPNGSSATEDFGYVPQASSTDLAITMTDIPDPVPAGGNITYTVRVTNSGPSDAADVAVTDTLPAGVTFVSASGSGWTCVHASGVVTCTRPNLPVGPAPDITIIVTAPGNSGTVISTASVSTTTTDFNSANDTATTSTAVIGTGDIAGTVFNDLDGDGVRNAGEPGLAGATITLRNDANAVIAVTVTAADGSYAFVNLQPGTYTVTETDPAGLVSTTANSVPVVVAADRTATVNFGDRQAVAGTGAVTGVVFQDANGDGVRNAGEPGLAGATITLRNDANAVIAVTVTAADGSYAFVNLQPGTYTVTETDPAGFVSTTANSVPVVVAANGTATVNFGDRQAAGTVAVPTMTEWGMILFVVLAGLLAVQRLRRQRALR